MLADVTAACEAMGAALSGLDPSLLSGVQCAQVVELLARTEKRCAALRALSAARAASCNSHKERGFPDAASWLAHTSGVTAGEARNALSTAAALTSAPLTREALLAGQMSLAQAGEITKTEKAVPGSEADLVELAARSSIAGLREAARKRRLEAVDRDEHHRRQHRERYLRHWQDDNGMFRVSASFTADVGVAFANRVDTETDRLARAGADPPTDTREQLAADALAALVADRGAPRARNAEVVLVCDIEAFWRGHTHPGETCQVIGGGPVPVSVLWDQRYHAFIKAVLHDGVTISTVAHFGRHISAELRTALGLGVPTLFDGAVCHEPGCDRRYHLQYDHADPLAHHGPTSYDNLQPLCGPHHREKTRRDREAGLLGPHPPNPTPRPSPTAGPDPTGGPDPPRAP